MARRFEHSLPRPKKQLTDQQLRDEHEAALTALAAYTYSGLNDQSDDDHIQRLNEALAETIYEMECRPMNIPGPYHPSELQGKEPR